MSISREKKSNVLVLAHAGRNWVENHDQQCEQIRACLKGGVAISDAIFDRVYPKEISDLSKINWTSVKTGMLAAKLLCGGSPRRVLDVGAGCGKFCSVAALSSEGLYTGVEQQPGLLAVASETARLLEADSAKFILGNVFDLNWMEYDAFYFFNPFGDSNREEYVRETKSRLASSRNGTRVVTYYGYGGAMPSCYARARKISVGSDFLELWIKV